MHIQLNTIIHCSLSLLLLFFEVSRFMKHKPKERFKIVQVFVFCFLSFFSFSHVHHTFEIPFFSYGLNMEIAHKGISFVVVVEKEDFEKSFDKGKEII